MNDCQNLGTRLEYGAPLPSAVEQLAEQYGLSFCDVSGFGALEWIELSVDEQGGVLQRFEGPMQLIALNGRLRMAGTVTLCDFYCTLSRQTDNGIQVLGGKLHRAEAAFAELTFYPLAPLEAGKAAAAEKNPVESRSYPTREMTKAPPQSQAQPVKTEERPRVEPAAPPFTPPIAQKEVNRVPAALDDRWAKAVLESKRIEEDPSFFDDDEDTDTRPKRGDLVLHAQFGECQVSRIDDDHITLRKPDGRNVQLGLTVLRFKKTGEKKDKAVFRVEIGKR